MAELAVFARTSTAVVLAACEQRIRENATGMLTAHGQRTGPMRKFRS